MFTATDFESLATDLDLPDFDLMLVGDGSGGVLTTPCGWFCAAYYRPSGRVSVHSGGTTSGTTNYAELMPYVHVLWAFHSAWQAKHPDGGTPSFRVVIVTDSELTARCGSGRYARRANLALWAALDWFVEAGYRIHWHHIPRNTNPISKRADRVAKGRRVQLEQQA